jgi:hypothetical protein
MQMISIHPSGNLVRHVMNAQGKQPRDINSYREAVICQRARDLVVKYWRLAQARAGKTLTALEILPIEPRLIATEVLGMTFEEPEEIGSVQSEDSLRIEVAGTMDRRVKKISVARKFSSEIRRFTGGHEIGHYMLDHGSLNLRESPVTDAVMRNPLRSAREREADLFAAELLMPRRPMHELFARLVGEVVEGSLIDENRAFCLTAGKMSASDLKHMEPIELAKLVAEAESLTFHNTRCLADIFGVSPMAMAVRLLNLRLVR